MMNKYDAYSLLGAISEAKREFRHDNEEGRETLLVGRENLINCALKSHYQFVIVK